MATIYVSDMSDDDVVYELELRGFPEELTKPLRDYVNQPVPCWSRLAAWNAAVKRESEAPHA